MPNPPQKQSQKEQQPQGESFVSMEATFSGPLPLPSILRGYELACAGAADRVIKMAESQGAHRRRMEERGADAAIEDMRRDYTEARYGQIFGLAIAIGMMLSGVYVAVSGHPWPGATLGSGGLAFQLVNLFVRGRKSPAKGAAPAYPPTPKRVGARKR